MTENYDNPNKNGARPPLWAATVCLLAACCGAGYLAVVSILGGGLAGCLPESGCNAVLSSGWAYWLGLPVSVPALAFYATLLALAVSLSRRGTADLQQWRWKAAACMSIIVLGAACWFVLLQVFVVKALCKFCLATHLSASIAAACLLMRAFSLASRSKQLATAAPRNFGNWRMSMLFALVALAVLIGVQIVIKKRLYGANLFSGLSESASNQIRLHRGKFRLAPAELPLMDTSSATNYIVSLFDYTCTHCRALHPLLKEALAKYRGQLGIVALPAPLDAMCNPTIMITAAANENSCEYARLSLAVWHSRHEAFAQFDDWLFASTTPPSIDQARSKAEELIGKEALAKALAAPWVERQIQFDVLLYQANARAVHDARLPQLNIGDVIAHGAIDNSQDLLKLIEQGYHKGKL